MKKRLAIDIQAVPQAYEAREIRDISSFSGEPSPSDTLANVDGNTSLTILMKTDTLTFEKQSWVDREPPLDLRTVLTENLGVLAAELKPLVEPASFVEVER